MQPTKRPIHRRLSRIIIAGLLLCTISACSLATLAYNNAGMLIGYALDGYVDLSPQQEIWLKDRVNVLIAWHRSNELPEWQRWLIETRELAAGKPQLSDVQNTYAGGRALLARTTEKLLPDMVLLLRQMEPPQIASLERKFALDNRKIAEDAAAASANYQAERMERLRKRFESWLGSLTAEQDAHLQSRMAALPSLEEMRLLDRKRWQREFVDLVKAKPETATMQAELRRLVLVPEANRDPVYQAELMRRHDEMMAVTAWIVAKATPAQKKHLQKKLSGYAEDIAYLLRT